MRRTRRLILLLIVCIVSGVITTYLAARKEQVRSAPPAPQSLPASLSAQAKDWSYEKTDGNRTIFRAFAKDLRQLSEGSRLELDHVTLQLFHKNGKTFDEVKSAKADFDVNAGVLFSEGEVEITMGLPAGFRAGASRLVHIKTSGVRFDSKTGSATTDRPAAFKFDRGEGRSVGANYDPAVRQLHMHNNVALSWFGDKSNTTRMEVEAGSVVYHEDEAKIYLTPWTKFRRGTLNVEAAGSVVLLNDGIIRQVDSQQARGTNVQAARKLHFGADEMRLEFNDKGAVEHLIGEKNASLLSEAPSGLTSVKTQRIDLNFEPGREDSVLAKALATRGAVVEAHPAQRTGAPRPETRVVRSETIALYMRPGGEEIDRMETEAPGVIEFLPNAPVQKKRRVEAERMYLHYGPENQLKKFHAVTVATRTENPPVAPGKPVPPPTITRSAGMLAEFETKTGALEQMEQWGKFQYEEGPKRAVADKATLISAKDELMLTGAARVWDPSGSTSADVIALHQKNGDFGAQGNVNSTRIPEKNKKQKEGMLSGEEPMHAKAARMSSVGDNTQITYEGNAFMWQGPNRLQAGKISIDRKQGTLLAEEKVVSQLLDKSESKTPANTKKPAAFTVVRAPRMTYSDKDRLAHYTGGAVLTRATTVVTANEIRALMKQEGDSSLEKALADGDVKIVQKAPRRTRTGSAEHAEYYSSDGRVILSGGSPELLDSVEGVTRGKQLTYFSSNDRLLVEGAQSQPARSELLRR